MNKKLIIGVGIAGLIVAGVFYSQSNTKILVESYKIEELKPLAKYVEETATIKAREQQEIYTSNPGEIKEILVKEGQTVRVDELLGMLNEENVKLQLEQLEANEKELNALYDETLKPADWQTIQKARSNLEIANTNFIKAETDYINAQKLYTSGAMNQNTFDQQKTNFEIQQNNLNIAKSQLSLVQKKVSANVEMQIKSQIEALGKNILIAHNNLDKYSFKSKINGIVTEIPFKEGRYLQPGMKIFEVTDLTSMYLETEVLASDVKDLEIGDKVIIEEEDLGVKTTGEITFISPKAYSKISDLGIEQKRIKVEIEPNKIDKNMRLNYEVTVKLVIEEKSETLTIPNSAIFEIEGEDYVFVIRNSIANLTKIEKGLEGDEETEILKGINKGDEIVDSPSDELENKVKIQITE